MHINHTLTHPVRRTRPDSDRWAPRESARSCARVRALTRSSHRAVRDLASRWKRVQTAEPFIYIYLPHYRTIDLCAFVSHCQILLQNSRGTKKNVKSEQPRASVSRVSRDVSLIDIAEERIRILQTGLPRNIDWCKPRSANSRDDVKPSRAHRGSYRRTYKYPLPATELT